MRSLIALSALLAGLVATTPTKRQEGCGTLPANIPLTSNPALNDPFTFLDGSQVQTAADFKCRQAEISSLMQKYELGTKPAAPQTLSASFASNSLSITATNAGKSITWNVGITYPTTGTAPFPAIIAYDGLSIPAPAGVAVLTFSVSTFAAQNDASSRNQGTFYNLFPQSDAGALMAWAWGVSRIMDALQQTPSARIDPTRVGVTGCSRNGKGALVAGAFEPRIALTIPQESGSGGDACWRLSDYQTSQGQQVQTLSEIVTENVWFATQFASFSGKTNTLPFDHHLLAGLIAPRPMLSIENADYLWLGPYSTFGCMTAAHTIWQALGAPDKMGYSEVGGHAHCSFPSSEAPDLNAFINKFLLNQNTNTNIFKNDQNFSFNIPNQFVNWDVPTLS